MGFRYSSNTLGPMSATESQVLLHGFMEAAAKRKAAEKQPPPKFKKPSEILSDAEQSEIRGAWMDYITKFNNQFSSPQAQTTMKHRCAL